MSSSTAYNEYAKALRMGQKETRELRAAGRDPYPRVLDELLPQLSSCAAQELGVQDVPADRIVGVRYAGRTDAFSAGFYPLLDEGSEFAFKWIALCDAHLSETGIRDPILCYEYLGDFYVQEGNKRVSVLKYFGAPRIPARIRRILPPRSDEPRIRAYYEFLDFYERTRLYDVQFRKPGSYARLLACLDADPAHVWTEQEQRAFSSRYHRFKTAFLQVAGRSPALPAEEALLVWLQVHGWQEIAALSDKDLRQSLTELWGDVVTEVGQDVQVRTVPDGGKGVLGKLISAAPGRVNAAMIHWQDAEVSAWTRAHAQGAEEMCRALGEQVQLRSYYHADTAEQAAQLLEQAVADGAELVFTTTPTLCRATMKAAVKYPKVRFLNCSVDTPLSSVRSYYCRTFEGKFITGLIAGAMAEDGRIGYVGSYPILGVPAAINAFALGARMTNPRATIELEWSCVCEDAAKRLADRGVRVISNRDVPLQDRGYLSGGEYGICLLDEAGRPVPLASPCWRWGRLYTHVVRTVLAGSWSVKKGAPEAVNYWWGMDSGAIDVEMTEQVPAGVRFLAENMIDQLRFEQLDPFRQRLVSQDGTLRSDGARTLTKLELLRMDWLCDNVTGHIPGYDELLPNSRQLVRELGVYRDAIPPERSDLT